MDKTLTMQFIVWLHEQGIYLYREDTSLVTDGDVRQLMDKFVDEWFNPTNIRLREGLR